jgi:SNF2 family DNA or RNA helicase
MYRHIMTGTGFVNRPDEMWSLLDFLQSGEGGYWKFRGHFCQEIIDRGFRVVVGIKPHRVSEFRDLRKKLGPRRMMADVHAGIGHPIESVHEVELNATQRRMYNEIKNVLRTLDQAGEPIASPNVLSQLNRLRQISVATPHVDSRGFDPIAQRVVTDISLIEPSSKLDECMDILKELRDAENQPQAVVFSCFRDPLHLLSVRLEQEGIPFLHMQQKHSDDERYRLWHDIFPRKDHSVFLSTLALGGESINLASAQYLIFLDRSWSPKDMMQAVGRVYRPGQKAVPEIIYINAKGTVDNYIKRRLDTKGKWFHEIFGD